MSDGHRPSASLEEEQPEDMLGGEGQDGTTDQRVAEDAHTEGTPPSEQTKGPVKRKRRQASSARQKGDNTLQHYTGALHQVLVVLVLRLRRQIACEDAFPCPLDFGVTTELMFAEEVQRPANKEGMQEELNICLVRFAADNSHNRSGWAGSLHCGDKISRE